MNRCRSLCFLAVVIACVAAPLSARMHFALLLTDDWGTASDSGVFVEVRLRCQQQTSPAKQAGDWASWRGPVGSGEAFGSPPTEWGEEKNIKWKTVIPGLGCSTPIAWKDRIYLTTAVAADEGGKAAPGVLDFRVLCIRLPEFCTALNASYYLVRLVDAVLHHGVLFNCFQVVVDIDDSRDTWVSAAHYFVYP